MSGSRGDLDAVQARKQPDRPGPWKRAVLWFVPVLLWVAWLVYAVHDIDAHWQAIRNESVEPGQNLAACLDFALDNFSTPSPSKRDACNEQFPRDQAKVATEKAAHSKHIVLDIASLVVAAGAMGLYFAVVPRRFRAGFRVWIFVVVGGGLLTVLAFVLILSGMRRGD